MAEKESKKRKRPSNGAETPSKKVAFATSAGSDRVDVNFNQPSGLYPALVSTPGLTAPRISLKAYAKPLSSKQSKDAAPKPQTHALLLQSSDHPRLDHVATQSNLDQGMAHYTAIFDPTANKLQIIPAYHLNLRASPRSEQEQEQKSRVSRQDQREALVGTFGTKKAQKALEEKRNDAFEGRGSLNKQQAGKDVQSAIVDSMAAPSGNALLGEQEALESSLSSKPIPKPNLAAENVEDVYSLNSLMPPQDAKLVTIKEWQDQIKAGNEVSLSHRFPAHRVKAIAMREDVARLKALAYINLLFDFNAALASAGRTGKKVPRKEVLHRKLSNWPDNLVSSVSRRFSTPTFELPKWHLERLYTHICALALYIDGYVTETKELREDLKVEQKEITQYFRELGCKVAPPTEKEREARGLKKAEVSLVKIAKLKLPLDFPKVAKARAGRRR